jgi:hypothetical protein
MSRSIDQNNWISSRLGKQRINRIEELNEMLSAWEDDCNARQKGGNWQFTAEDARIKLKRLYPSPLFHDEK